MLQKMFEQYGIDAVNTSLTEYLILVISKAMKCDIIADALNDENCTIDHIRELLYE